MDFQKAFKPLDWQAQFVGMTKEAYKELTDKVADTFIPCNTDAGKEMFDAYIAKAFKKSMFGTNMVDVLTKNVDNVVIVTDTTYLVGYLMVDQMDNSIKYYMDYRLSNKLKSENRMPRTAEDVYKFFMKQVGFVPMFYKAVSLSDLTNNVSYSFKTIKRVIEEGDNTSMWSHAIKVQIEASFSHLEYMPNEDKFYFIMQGNHGWYLKADTEKNEVLKQKFLAAREAKRKAAEAAKDKAVDEEQADAVEEPVTEENVTAEAEAEA